MEINNKIAGNGKSILQSLKTETAHLHNQLERNPLMQQLTSPAITLAGYARILKLFYGYFAPLETTLHTIPTLLQHLPDFASRRKANLLLNDLAIVEENPADVSTIPLASDLPQISGLAGAFGCLYVMEGSTLGGRFIAKNLQEKLSLTAENGLQFFSGYGSETGSRWNAFRDALVKFNAANSGEEQIIGTANLTFIKLDSWFS